MFDMMYTKKKNNNISLVEIVFKNTFILKF